MDSLIDRHPTLVARHWWVALVAAALVLLWQATTVRWNYGGDWSALFRIGDRWPLPPELSGEARVFANDAGYDGVFYHLAAHDPWLQRGFSRYADNPSLRWRRILTPASAHLLALGRDGRIHAAYIAVNVLFVFLGTGWLARLCAREGASPAWGFGFLAVPSVLVSIDRLTIDTALAALTVGLALHTPGEPATLEVGAQTAGTRVDVAPARRPVRTLAGWLVLALCPLARETGLALTAGLAWYAASRREWRRVVSTLATATPFLLWAAFVFVHTPRDGTAWFSLPLAGIVRRTAHPLQFPITGSWVALAAALDYLALIGIWVGFFLVLRLACRRSFGWIEATLYVTAAGAACLGKADIWGGAYEFGRTLSPLLILLGLVAMRGRALLYLLPLACVLPRILLQYEPQLRGILKGLT